MITLMILNKVTITKLSSFKEASSASISKLEENNVNENETKKKKL